jgi:hypothetical protein
MLAFVAGSLVCIFLVVVRYLAYSSKENNGCTNKLCFRLLQTWVAQEPRLQMAVL